MQLPTGCSAHRGSQRENHRRHRNDGATPREIVGAIANEAGLEGRYIGRIEIRDDHSVVDLPDGMPKDVYRHLQGVFVCGKALRIRPLGAGGPKTRTDPPQREPNNVKAKRTGSDGARRDRRPRHRKGDKP